ncbi:MAG: nucleotide exchange factor GrpE, partial [Candidatus Methanomethylophilaceae archaeon]|nr:nucleotide exchange factor GrpE [Candidatus Methanomethylophilaceae archaeon]
MTDKSKQEKAEEEEPKADEEPQVDPLAEAQAKADEYLDMARRVQADFDNYRRRSQKEKEEYKSFATADLMSDLLTIVDDLDRALE